MLGTGATTRRERPRTWPRRDSERKKAWKKAPVVYPYKGLFLFLFLGFGVLLEKYKNARVS